MHVKYRHFLAIKEVRQLTLKSNHLCPNCRGIAPKRYKIIRLSVEQHNLENPDNICQTHLYQQSQVETTQKGCDSLEEVDADHYWSTQPNTTHFVAAFGIVI